MSEIYKASYYRTSQYSSYEEAEKNGGVYHWTETYGYTSTMDSFTNVQNVLDCCDLEAKYDLRIVWNIDGVNYPECSFAESHDLLNRSYNYFHGTK
jgi:hypothetical protein